MNKNNIRMDVIHLIHIKYNKVVNNVSNYVKLMNMLVQINNIVLIHVLQNIIILRRIYKIQMIERME